MQNELKIYSLWNGNLVAKWKSVICEMETPDFKSEICVENSASCKDESTTWQ